MASCRFGETNHHFFSSGIERTTRQPLLLSSIGEDVCRKCPSRQEWDSFANPWSVNSNKKLRFGLLQYGLNLQIFPLPCCTAGSFFFPGSWGLCLLEIKEQVISVPSKRFSLSRLVEYTRNFFDDFYLLGKVVQFLRCYALCFLPCNNHFRSSASAAGCVPINFLSYTLLT